MGTSANVTSLDAMRSFYAALVRFEEEAGLSLAMMQSESLRTLDWIENDRPFYWKNELRKAHDWVAQARKDLESCKMRRFGDFRPSCIQEKKELEKAKIRLQYCQVMIDELPRWAGKIRHESEEHRGKLGQVGHIVAADVPQMLAILKNMIMALEDYADISRAPSGSGSSKTTSSSSTDTTSGNSGTTTSTE